MAPRAAPRVVRKRDALRTKRNVLDAARVEFAANGLAGARVEAIAARARANKRMIYQYFGSKEGLYVAALEATYTAFRTEERSLGLESLPPVEAMRRLAAFNLDYCRKHPEFISLLNNENLHRARYLKKSKAVPPLHATLAATIAAILARGVRDGVFRPGVDPVRFYIALASLGYFYHSNRHTLSVIFRTGLGAESQWKAYAREAVDMVLGYLRPDPGPLTTARPGLK